MSLGNAEPFTNGEASLQLLNKTKEFTFLKWKDILEIGFKHQEILVRKEERQGGRDLRQGEKTPVKVGAMKNPWPWHTSLGPGNRTQKHRTQQATLRVAQPCFRCLLSPSSSQKPQGYDPVDRAWSHLLPAQEILRASTWGFTRLFPLQYQIKKTHNYNLWNPQQTFFLLLLVLITCLNTDSIYPSLFKIILK